MITLKWNFEHERNNKMKRNKVVMVDINDNVVGTKEKIEAHKTPILHRAFSIYLYNSSNEMLIQKRADHKYHSVGLWSNACCSHPQLNENIKQGALERLENEIGIKTDIEELFSFIYMNKFNDSLYEYEYDHVFIGKYDGDFILNPEEASDAKWISIDELKKDLTLNPKAYSAWFIISAPRVIEFLEKKKIG